MKLNSTPNFVPCMFKKWFAYFLLAGVATFNFSCKKDREAPNGLKVRVLKEGQGTYAKPGEFVITSMIVKDAKDSIWRDTHDQNLPMILPVGDESQISTEKGLESVFRVMKIGDSIAVDIEAQLLARNGALPPKLKPTDLLTYIFAVRDITDQVGVNRLQMELQQRQTMEARKELDRQLAADTVAIDAYLAANKINAVKDDSGLRYVITRKGKGPSPTVRSTVKIKYKGWLFPDGKVFDQSNGSVEYPVNIFIQGWQIGLPLIQKGGTATLYIPSGLAYGVNGYQPDIPPNANLVFEIELIDFKN